jgi:hypothetical protein
MIRYKKIGQRYPIPKKDDPLRIFYKSLHKQNKHSKMAMKWLLEHGLFSKEKSERIAILLQMEELTLRD